MLGKTVIVTMDRKLGTRHPKHGYIYPINYGYVEGIMAPDGDFQDAYVLGPSEPLDTFEGRIIAIVHRKNDVEDKWVVANESYTVEQIERAIHFQEQYFDHEIIM